ncbi:hypothetical protein FAES_2186 [Fibrella aestuarina BUZ 2]|uniref:Lipocalin-like domain-containing protein n=1 Tax=Fibrella aestuarina BUZ 2 TaxID=1166018 RepID=I0K7U2_9BACT|nr:hypothetical protein [Fibrella aestuarina]CCH00195.1 hypothetical protein FAES_2186 [Fibrella aestuarina BUZ 2]
MKTLLLAASLILTTALASCKKSDDAAPATTTTTADDVKPVLTTGTWSVSLYRQRTEIKTADYSGITFTFLADGTLTATEKGKTIRGTWTSTPGGVTYYGAAPSVATLTINLGKDKPYDRISQSWNVNAATVASNIKLDYKEPADDEHLELVR